MRLCVIRGKPSCSNGSYISHPLKGFFFFFYQNGTEKPNVIRWEYFGIFFIFVIFYDKTACLIFTFAWFIAISFSFLCTSFFFFSNCLFRSSRIFLIFSLFSETWLRVGLKVCLLTYSCWYTLAWTSKL